jgi:hypothetical protein
MISDTPTNSLAGENPSWQKTLKRTQTNKYNLNFDRRSLAKLVIEARVSNSSSLRNIKQPSVKRVTSLPVPLHKNPLRGERIPYHLSTIREVETPRKKNCFTVPEKKSIATDFEEKDIALIKNDLEHLRKFLMTSDLDYHKPSSKLINSTAELTIITDELSSEKSIKYCYSILKNALSHGIYYYFNDEGHLTTLKQLEDILRIRFKINHDKYTNTKKNILEMGEKNKRNFDFINDNDDITNIKMLSKINLPTKISVYINEENYVIYKKIRKISILTKEHLTPKQALCFGLMQRMYSSSSIDKDDLPSIPAFTFLLFCHNQISLADLLHLITIGIELPAKEMPIRQKMMMLNLLRMGFSSNIYVNEKNSPQTEKGIKEIENALKRLGNHDLLIYFQEIVYSLNNEITNLSKENNAMDIEDVINKIINGKYTITEIRLLVVVLAKDIKFLSALSIYKSSPLNLFSQNSFPASVFNDKVYLFLKEMQEADKKKNGFYNMFLILLAYELVSQNEYAGSMAILTLLDFIDPILSKKIAAFHKDDVNLKDIKDKYAKLKTLFLAHQGYEVLRETIKQCQFHRKFFVPHTTPYSLYSITTIEKIKGAMPDAEEDKTNSEKYKLKESRVIYDISSLFHDVRYHFERAAKTQKLQTNISDAMNRIFAKANEEATTAAGKS